MEPEEFWVELFRGRVLEAELGHPCLKDAALALTAAHRTQYGRHLGPSVIDVNDHGCTWTFMRCGHGERKAVCTAHIGFLRGLLEGMKLKNVNVERYWDAPVCKLNVLWEGSC